MQSLFHGALDLPEAERRPFLKTSCVDDQSLMGDVLAMLEEDASATSLLNRDVAQVAREVLGDAAHAAFREFGPYRIKSILGEGGMGVVYLAEREDLGIQVAIKILRDAWLSPARRERFASEQRTLAQLNHPSIARLYDADTWPDGTPWFVMEYVDGLQLTDYCSYHKCCIEERLRLFRALCEAVQYAHGHAVIHRDLKPSNILVKSDGSVRLLDFGIAKHLDPVVQPVDRTGTGVRLMTPAYAAPEQIRGERAGIHTDVYSLGVILYELLSGRLPFDISRMTPAEAATAITAGTPAKPSSAARAAGTRSASWTDLDVLCLTAMNKDPNRRYQSVEAFVRDLDHYLKQEPLEARPDSLGYTAAKFVRRNWEAVSAASATVALIVLAIALTLSLSGKGLFSKPRAKTVAVLPFQNTGNDHSVDFLRFALANDISSTLGYARSLSIRPSEATGKYIAPNLDLQKAGRELRVNRVVTGHFLKAGEQLQITLEVIDVESNRLLWREVFDVPAQNMMAMQAQIAAKTRRGLAPLLGVSEFVTDNPPKPRNEEAYNLFLRAKALSSDPEPTRQAIEMLERSLAIDPGYAPAWETLASKYLADSWFGNGGQAGLERWRAGFDRAVALDPDNIIFRADNLYIAGLVGRRTDNGGMTRGEAYRGLEDLVRRRPDNARLHFLVSWMLRDAGLLEESARECDTSVLVDAQDAQARSCGVTFMLRGDYRRALDYLHLDPGSAFEKTISIDVFVRQGRQKDALEAERDAVPHWGGYDMLLAFLEHKPAAEVAALAGAVRPASDPEMNYFSAAHLAYCGQAEAALRMLKETIQGGYCSYPAIDSDPLFASLREKREFAGIRSAAIACQNDFVAQRGQAPR
jgi:serine/threonine protein kinase/tetratricopeptide (TPR) repeat protein